MNNLKRNKLIVSVVLVAVLVTAILGVNIYRENNFKNGVKEIIVELQAGDYSRLKGYKTDKNTLSELIKEEMGEDVTYIDEGSLMVTGIYGFTPDVNKQEWLKIYVNGFESSVGADDIILEDGQTIQFELNIGW